MKSLFPNVSLFIYDEPGKKVAFSWGWHEKFIAPHHIRAGDHCKTIRNNDRHITMKTITGRVVKRRQTAPCGFSLTEKSAAVVSRW
jgi:hypothetical protein